MTTLDSLRSRPHRFTLFAALRLVEQLHADRPRLGEAKRIRDDPVRLAQMPHLAFAPADNAALASAHGGMPRLEQYVFGVFGPNGALPLHLTEYAFERAAHRGDPGVSDFINAFQHRFIALFYRAWADGEPVVNLDRPHSDRFARYIGALAGLGTPAARAAAPLAARAALGRAALFGQTSRSADALERALSDHFGLRMRIQQFVAGWLEIPEEARTRTGVGRNAATLGRGATLGARSWQCQHQFEIGAGPLRYADLVRFVPVGLAFRELAAIVRLFTNDEWSWRLRLTLAVGETPGVTLGGQTRLGWTTWLEGRPHSEADVVIRGNWTAQEAAT